MELRCVHNTATPIVTFRLFTSGIISNPDLSGLDNSTYKIQSEMTPWCPLGYLDCALVKLGSH